MTATGARRCPSGAAAAGICSASARWPSCRSCAAVTSPASIPTGPSSTRWCSPAPPAPRPGSRRRGRHGAPGGAGHRRLVRLRLDAGGAGRLSPHARDPRRPSPSRPTSSPRPSTRRAGGSTRCWPSTRWCSARPPTSTWCAWATSSTPTAAKCPSRWATSSIPGRSSTPGARTRCAGGCSARARRGRRPGPAWRPSTPPCATCC